MSALYIFEDIDRISTSWHDGGSVVIVTDRDPNEAWLDYLRGIAAEHPSNGDYLKDAVVRQTLPDPSAVYELKLLALESVRVFENAGCC